MVIHNATFMAEHKDECSLIAWLRGRIKAMEGLRSPRLSAMREAGGVDSSQAECVSISFQCEFTSEADALKWREERLAPTADDFMAEFGPNAMIFTSIFEIISI